ncbi:long-chain-fatty-acid--CoA ligase [Paenibacillus marchantiophytorum]|uniref:Long-chain-fatty-acid--CoA ligase n=1 Tax=Paenibacillus marchantiophytorum TaxID=1619310 RepID=A0ABQ1FDQ8_9BACL|nr:long-chain fatty acid--CoA ligase [Paenibacillus marchantiophytorum]GGA08391.1 long-chain-fatty-acid--CoA ligase [Paenibacillus marchantiophytorum]
MENYPLTLRALFDRSQSLFGKKEVVSRTNSGISRYTYADFGRRTRQLSSALQGLGVKPGDRIATFAWNHHWHLEAYFAIPCMGAVLHTVNIRLPLEHIVYILNHAQDRFLFVDETLLPVIEKIQDQLTTIEGYIIMTDRQELPPTSLQPVYGYENILNDGDPQYMFSDDIHESAPAGLCYTSATTGKPKGVVYSHRGIYLHSLSIGLADTLGLSERDTVMPIVPMFHVNAWGLPFASVWFGSKQVLPGPAPTPGILLGLMADEQVTIAAGVPTVWTAALKAQEAKQADLSTLRAVVCGGSAAPRSLIESYEQRLGIPFYHAYGMTETCPLVTVARLKSYQDAASYDEQYTTRATQGLLVPGLEMKIVGPRGEVAWDGHEMGEILLRGPWVATAYYQDERTQESFHDGWFHSGDIAVIDQEGFVKLVDRAKDLVKSGGEWISSLDLENTLMAHPNVFEACVIGVPHPKWGERPLAFVVLKDFALQAGDKADLLHFLTPKFAKWWIPDDVIFLQEIPRSSVGKFMKRELREQYQTYFTGD